MTKKHIFASTYIALTVTLIATTSVYARQNSQARDPRHLLAKESNVMSMGNRIFVAGAVITTLSVDTITATTNENNILTTWLISRTSNTSQPSTKNATKKNRAIISETIAVGDMIDFSGRVTTTEVKQTTLRGIMMQSNTTPSIFSVTPFFIQSNSTSVQNKFKKEAQSLQEKHTDGDTHKSMVVPEREKYTPTPALVSTPILEPTAPAPTEPTPPTSSQESSNMPTIKDEESSSLQPESKDETSLPKDESSLQNTIPQPTPIVFPITEELNMHTEQPHTQVTLPPAGEEVKKDDNDTLYTILQPIIN
jgi:hypothetical protein